MSRARDLADYVSTGVTAAEFDFLDTTSGTPGSGNFLRGDKTWATAGAVLKVQSAIHTEKEDIAGATTANNYADVPGLSISSFTTTGSNTVLLIATLSVGGSNSNPTWFRFLRGTTPVGVGTEPLTSQSSATARIRMQTVTQDNFTIAMSAMDSPGAGTHTYKVQWQAESGGTGMLNKSHNDTDGYYNASLSSNLTVMEINV